MKSEGHIERVDWVLFIRVGKLQFTGNKSTKYFCSCTAANAWITPTYRKPLSPSNF